MLKITGSMLTVTISETSILSGCNWLYAATSAAIRSLFQ
jgi:hypothetical protein